MTSTPAPNTTTSKPLALEIVHSYAGVGTAGMLANAFILAVLISDKKFFKQSANIAGIAISHLLCSMAIGAAGWYRAVNYDVLAQPAPTWVCVTRIYPAMLVFAFQSMGIMLILVGVERFLVFMVPHWYRNTWTSAFGWRMVGMGYTYVAISGSIGIYIAVHQPMTTLSCPYQPLFGKEYIVYSSGISVLGGVVAVGFTVIGLIKGNARIKKLPLLSGEAGRYRRQMKLTRSMLSVAICDVGLVVIPNIFLVLSIADPTLFAKLAIGNLSNYTNITYCVNTVMSLGLYLAFHKVFRTRAAELLRLKKKTANVIAVGDEVRAMEMRMTKECVRE